MFIKDVYTQKKPVISFEVFPPKKGGGIEGILGTLSQLTGLAPDYISVTYGAGGGPGSAKTREIAAAVRQEGVESLAHLTCVGASRESIRTAVSELRAAGIENIMALRGDLPPDAPPAQGDFPHAADLIRELRTAGGFSVGAACYPEGHIDCDDDFRDLVYLRDKQDAGADFLVTQLFFDNDIFFRYRERAAKQGISLPISAGIMPIFSQKQIERMIFMCGVSLPSAIVRLLHRYENDPEALRRAGIDYAVGQIDSLIRGGVDGIHLYTMNQPLAAIKTMEHCRSLGLRRS